MAELDGNKLAGAIFLAGVVSVGISLAVNGLYGPDEHGTGHGKEARRGYRIEGVEVAKTEKKEDKPVQIARFFDEASLKRGESLFRACAACHNIEQGGAHKVGPNLWDVVGAPMARHDDYAYSNALAGYGGEWGYQQLSQFLYKPRKYVAGTKMAYAGMRKPEDRASLLLYLRSKGENPPPLPDVSKAEPAGDEPKQEGDKVEASPEKASTTDSEDKQG